MKKKADGKEKIIEIAKEFSQNVGDDCMEHVAFFKDKNYPNLEEIVTIGCESLTMYQNYVRMLEKLMVGARFFIETKVNNVTSNENKKEDSVPQLTLDDYKKMLNHFNENFVETPKFEHKLDHINIGDISSRTQSMRDMRKPDNMYNAKSPSVFSVKGTSKLLKPSGSSYQLPKKSSMVLLNRGLDGFSGIKNGDSIQYSSTDYNRTSSMTGTRVSTSGHIVSIKGDYHPYKHMDTNVNWNNKGKVGSKTTYNVSNHFLINKSSSQIAVNRKSKTNSINPQDKGKFWSNFQDSDKRNSGGHHSGDDFFADEMHGKGGNNNNDFYGNINRNLSVRMVGSERGDVANM